MDEEGRFQVAVGAVIQNTVTKKILLIYRSKSQFAGGIWEIPIGRIKQFESIEAGLKREVEEETGITNLIVGMPLRTFEFMRGAHRAENEVRAIIFAARTTQEEVTVSNEHTSHRWVTIDEGLKLVETPGIKADLLAYQDSQKTLRI